MTYRVRGTAHGSAFDERGFATSEDAEAYASEVLSGDVDGTIEVELEHRTRVVEEATVIARDSIRATCDCGWYGTPFLANEYADARRDGKAHEREEVRREVVGELLDYIDGDAENGPRFGVEVSDEEIEEEVDRRMRLDRLDSRTRIGRAIVEATRKERNR